jgi:hypothetical protein
MVPPRPGAPYYTMPSCQGLLEQAMLKESSPAQAAVALNNSHVMALHSCCPLDYANTDQHMPVVVQTRGLALLLPIVPTREWHYCSSASYGTKATKPQPGLSATANLTLQQHSSRHYHFLPTTSTATHFIQ